MARLTASPADAMELSWEARNRPDRLVTQNPANALTQAAGATGDPRFLQLANDRSMYEALVSDDFYSGYSNPLPAMRADRQAAFDAERSRRTAFSGVRKR